MNIDYAEIFAEQEEIIEKQNQIIQKLLFILQVSDACEREEKEHGVD